MVSTPEKTFKSSFGCQMRDADAAQIPLYGGSEVPQGGSIPHVWVHPPTMGASTLLGAYRLTVWLARLWCPPSVHPPGLHGSGVPLHSSAWACAALDLASSSFHLPGLARLQRPPPFICLACAAWASPAVHLPGLTRLGRPPLFICLGLHGSGVPLHSSAWLARLGRPPPFIRLPSQTDSHSIYFITGRGGPNGHVHSQGQGGLWIYPHALWMYPP
ncbi:hypothetical protein B0H11DRAFT_1934774 [Mycena galericulata]|nr:hypothetical protein B0H11DRAFT_1934774 [Mycena galericulata]